MKSFFTNSSDNLFYSDPRGSVRYASKPLQLLFENCDTALIGIFVSDFLLSEDGTKFDSRWIESLFSSGGCDSLKLFVKIGDSRRPAYITAMPEIDMLGLGKGIIFRLDFEPLADEPENDGKMPEEFFRTVLDSLSDAVLIVDVKAMKVAAANSTFLKESGLDVINVIGRTVQAVAHSGAYTSMLAGGICPLLETISHEKEAAGEHICTSDDGTMRIFEVSTCPVKNSANELKYVVHISRDVTNRRKAEEDVRTLARRISRANDELKLANDDLKQFAYIVSHDMRAPLVSIKGFSSELKRSVEELVALSLGDNSDPEEKNSSSEMISADINESINFIESAATRLDGMINAILKLARMGYRDFRSEKIYPEEIVNEIISSLAHQIEEKKVKVNIAKLPAISTDRIALTQIFGNLIDNALKYMDPERDGELKIFSETKDDTILFKVSDNGRGIAEDDLSKVFDLFKRVGKQDVKGEGMGLSYVKALVKRLEGSIECSSQLGVGTTLSFSLPINPDKADE